MAAPDNPGFHGGRHSEGLMNATEIVMHEMKSYLVGVVLDFFGEGVREPRKPPHPHAHR
jgi:hypothetical protein